MAQTYIGKDMPVSKAEALRHFNQDELRVFEFDNGKKWFIVPFIEFQYGRLSEQNKALKSVISVLKKYGLIDEDLKILIPPSSPSKGAKEMVMDKDKEKDKDKDEPDEKMSQNLLAPQMVKIFKIYYPDYPEDRGFDYPSCLQIAYKIASTKGWMKENVVNGKLVDTVQFWTEIVKFSTTDNWFKTRSISDFNKEYQRLIQKMNNGTTHKQPIATNGARVTKSSGAEKLVGILKAEIGSNSGGKQNS